MNWVSAQLRVAARNVVEGPQTARLQTRAVPTRTVSVELVAKSALVGNVERICFGASP